MPWRRQKQSKSSFRISVTLALCELLVQYNSHNWCGSIISKMIWSSITSLHYPMQILQKCSGKGPSSAHFMNMFSGSWVQRQIPTNLEDLSHDMVTQVYQTFSAVTFSTAMKRWIKRWSFDLLSNYSLFYIPLKNFSLTGKSLAYAWRSRP
jgi:hypothetical protein